MAILFDRMIKTDITEETEIVRVRKNKTKFKFEMEHLDEIREYMKQLTSLCNYNTIDSEKSRQDRYESWKKRIEEGKGECALTWYSDPDGVPYSEVPESEREDWMSQCYTNFSRWTPEHGLESEGWEPDEVYWFSISKNDTYTYQLILKEGDWVEFDSSRTEAFRNIGQNAA